MMQSLKADVCMPDRKTDGKKAFGPSLPDHQGCLLNRYGGIGLCGWIRKR